MTGKEAGMLWKIRCLAAWGFRALAIAWSFFITARLMEAQNLYPEEFAKVFKLGLADIAIIGFSALLTTELLGRLLSWTKPGWRLPHFSERKTNTKKKEA